MKSLKYKGIHRLNIMIQNKCVIALSINLVQL